MNNCLLAVLDEAFNLSTYLQKNNRELVTVSPLFKIFEKNMKDMRSEYESQFKIKQPVWLEKWYVNTEYMQRKRKILW